MGQCVSSHLHIKGRHIMNVFCSILKHSGVEHLQTMILMFCGDTVPVCLQSNVQSDMLVMA